MVIQQSSHRSLIEEFALDLIYLKDQIHVIVQRFVKVLLLRQYRKQQCLGASYLYINKIYSEIIIKRNLNTKNEILNKLIFQNINFQIEPNNKKKILKLFIFLLIFEVLQILQLQHKLRINIGQFQYRKYQNFYNQDKFQKRFVIIYKNSFNMSNPQKAAEFKAKGNEAFKNQNWQQAIDYFTQAIQYNPNDHVFYSNRSGSYCNLGQYQKALQDAEKCIQLNSGFARGYQRKGTALFYLNNLDSAINAYNDGLKVDPNNASLKNDLKAAQQKQNQSAGGFQGMNFGGQNPQFNQQYLNALIKLMQNPETKDMINDPSFMQKVQLVMQNPAAASVLIQQDPQLKKAFQVLSSDAPSTFNFQQMMKNMGKGGPGPNFQQPQPKKEQPKPQSQPKKQQKKQPEAPDVQMKNKGNESYKNKKFQQALSFYEQAIKLNPNEPLYYNNKAAAYIQLKQYQNALNQVSKGEQLFTDGIVKDFVKKAKILARKASILTHLDKLQQAIKAYEQSLIQDQNSKVKDELLKVRKIKKQKDDQAYINPALGQQHCENGNTLFKQGKFPQALAQYEEAIKRNPSVAKYYSNLGTVYVKLMQFPRARDCFDKALSKDAHYIKAYAKKGDCHFFLKQYHKALQTYQAGLKVDPQNQLCKQGVQKTQMAIFTANSQEDQQTRAKRAMQDPQIQQILQTPQVRNALADLQRDPKAINNVMKNPDLARKFQKLIQAGVLRTG